MKPADIEKIKRLLRDAERAAWAEVKAKSAHRTRELPKGEARSLGRPGSVLHALRCEWVTMKELGWTDGDNWFPGLDSHFPLVEGATLNIRYTSPNAGGQP